MKEVWKNIPNYKGYYQVSNKGRVKSLARIDSNNHPIKERILKGNLINKYLCVTLYRKNKGKIIGIHRLVLLTFVGPCPKNMEGCHNDGINFNNYLYNLRWDTKSNNAQDRINHGNSKHTKETKKKIGNTRRGKKYPRN